MADTERTLTIKFVADLGDARDELRNFQREAEDTPVRARAVPPTPAAQTFADQPLGNVGSPANQQNRVETEIKRAQDRIIDAARRQAVAAERATDEVERGAQSPVGFSGNALRQSILDAYSTAGYGYTSQDESDLFGNIANPTTFYQKLPGEVKNFLENSDLDRAARRAFSVTEDPTKAGGESAADFVGGYDKYFDLVTRNTQRDLPEAIKFARGNESDPELQSRAWQLENLPPLKERSKQDIGEPPGWQAGTEFEWHGIPLTVSETEEGERRLHGEGLDVPTAGVSRFPYDRGSFRGPRDIGEFENGGVNPFSGEIDEPEERGLARRTDLARRPTADPNEDIFEGEVVSRGRQVYADDEEAEWSGEPTRASEDWVDGGRVDVGGGRFGGGGRGGPPAEDEGDEGGESAVGGVGKAAAAGRIGWFGRFIALEGVRFAADVGSTLRQGNIDEQLADTPRAEAMADINFRHRIASSLPFGVGKLGELLDDPTGSKELSVLRPLQDETRANARIQALRQADDASTRLRAQGDVEASLPGGPMRSRAEADAALQAENLAINERTRGLSEQNESDNQAARIRIEESSVGGLTRFARRFFPNISDTFERTGLASRPEDAPEVQAALAGQQNVANQADEAVVRRERAERRIAEDRRANQERDLNNQLSQQQTGFAAGESYYNALSAGRTPFDASQQAFGDQTGREFDRLQNEGYDSDYIDQYAQGRRAQSRWNVVQHGREVDRASFQLAGDQESSYYRAQNAPIEAKFTDLSTQGTLAYQNAVQNDPSLAGPTAAKNFQDMVTAASDFSRFIKDANLKDYSSGRIAQLRAHGDTRGAALAEVDESERQESDAAGTGISGFLRRGAIAFRAAGERQAINFSSNLEESREFLGRQSNLDETNLRAQGRNITADARHIQDEATNQAAIFATRGGPRDDERANFTMRQGIASLQAYQWDLQHATEGTGEEVAPGSVGPRQRVSQDSRSEDINQGLAAVTSAIEDMQNTMHSDFLALQGGTGGGSDF